MALVVAHGRTTPTTSRLTSFIADVAAILVFVAIGRSTHSHGVNSSGMVNTTWPFAVGLCLGWTFAVLRRMEASSARTGAVIALFTVAIGMVLRVIAGQGTDVAFILVAIAFLGAAMVGWRLLLRATSARTS